VRALEKAGTIGGDRAMLDPTVLGFEIVCFAMVQLAAQGQNELAAFEDRMKARPMVRTEVLDSRVARGSNATISR
jgi:hypothetical protein